eukprot:CAMPEP_0172501952 /NCGR_PEP_ID=MMETSP1066-20121228/155221_1 /TAXON_ID=671091 /ORGANISM="Coscinodiscus wailesii, Strain CCMP2513" /LENGTH=283 /DNA_ID=CAMNT_0013277021 /DNA_START=236 /DNA_END=1087 /DNA_ORIENTATION=-
MMKIALCIQLTTFFHSTNNVALSFTIPQQPRATTTFVPQRHATFRAPSLLTTKTVTRKCPGTAGDDLRLFLSQSPENEGGGATAPQKKRRRKRKTKSAPTLLPKNENQNENDDNADEDVVGMVERDDNAFVDIQVRDIRDIVGGGRNTAESSLSSSSSPELASSGGDVAGGGSGDNDLSSLLADAKRLRGGVEKVSGDDDDDGVSLGSRIKDVISTIVTIDFFVVLGLLAWFLAGVFCSYVIKDDTVQIAFNGIFESVVQPALGILMIASAAGSALGNKDETN